MKRVLGRSRYWTKGNINMGVTHNYPSGKKSVGRS